MHMRSALASCSFSLSHSQRSSRYLQLPSGTKFSRLPRPIVQFLSFSLAMWALCRYNLGILYKAQGKLDGTDILLKRGTQDCTSLLVPEQRATAGGYISTVKFLWARIQKRASGTS